MAERTLAEEYFAIRRKDPRQPAKYALMGARHALKPTTLQWETFGKHFAVGTGQRDGFEIRAVVDYDQYASPTIETTDVNTGIRNPDFRWTGDPWDTRLTNRYIELESGYTLDQLVKDYRKSGMSKNVLWEDARQSLADEAAGYLGEDYVQLIVTVKVYVGGRKVGESQIGTDLIIDYRNLEHDLDDAVSDCALIDEAIDNAREELPGAIATAAATLAALENIASKPQIGA